MGVLSIFVFEATRFEKAILIEWLDKISNLCYASPTLKNDWNKINFRNKQNVSAMRPSFNCPEAY